MCFAPPKATHPSKKWANIFQKAKIICVLFRRRSGVGAILKILRNCNKIFMIFLNGHFF